MADSVYNSMQGTVTHGSGDPSGDAEHVTRRMFKANIRSEIIGATVEQIFVCELQADITVTNFYVVAGLDIGAATNNPTVNLASGTLAKGSLTAIATAIDLGTAFDSRTKFSTSAIVAANVAKGQALYLDVALGSGSPADIAEDCTLTFVVEYTLQN